jgi:hypothetical protein
MRRKSILSTQVGFYTAPVTLCVKLKTVKSSTGKEKIIATSSNSCSALIEAPEYKLAPASW